MICSEKRWQDKIGVMYLTDCYSKYGNLTLGLRRYKVDYMLRSPCTHCFILLVSPILSRSFLHEDLILASPIF